MARESIKCSECSLASRCIWREQAEMPELTLTPHVYQPRSSVFSAGDECDGLYIVRAGVIKSYAITDDGDEHILGFHYPGSIVGLEGFSRGYHDTYADSVDTSSICFVPRAALLKTMQSHPEAMLSVLRSAGGSVAQGVHAQLSLGTMSAERKIANFLLDTSAELTRQGYSSTELCLPMQRTEIARYLSLAIETVSRVFRKLEDSGVVSVDAHDRHQVTIASMPSLLNAARPAEERSCVLGYAKAAA